jgi:hypothetical protein
MITVTCTYKFPAHEINHANISAVNVPTYLVLFVRYPSSMRRISYVFTCTDFCGFSNWTQLVNFVPVHENFSAEFL